MALPADPAPSSLILRGEGAGYLEFLGLVINFGLDGRCL
jgi:hypothetical protein